MTAAPAALDPVALTQALVRCPSVTPADAGALDVLQGVLEPLGFVCHRLRFEEQGTAPVDNLYARLGTAGRNLCFAGHTDVVPPGDPAAWAADPFAGAIVDGKLYGRGASDMKAAVAAFAAAVARRLGRAGPPPGSISLLITGDEEGPAVNGTRKVLDWLAEKGEVLDACIVGEPTNPNTLGEMIKVGRRGSITGYLTVHGTQGHVAYPHLADNPLPRLVRMLAALTAEPLDRGNAHFQPSTLAITTIDVGNPADNVIPAKGSASFNIRFNDEHTSDTLKDWIRRTCDSVGGDYDLKFRVSGESFLTPPGRLSDLVADAVERVTGRRPELSTTGGTSDARFIRSHCPVVEFGIVGQTMHKVDEHVAVADVERLTAIYEAVIDGFFAPDPSPSTGGDAA
ncbi:succinyl-diaminopimelate desuccinylase [Skermanella mucosa]|uniref:succinyl-diaminopimelate desuccinylase n=1 Tax=Skermanella mucosa TaxID=1789672 RepID=UPI00192B3E17|nr:succinyl-diaminopimelate desuccinylase [Skermanella mucosa]UEM20059.1 succinyl-diaminopimelate desuccinylase [Skermanella mucosa]